MSAAPEPAGPSRRSVLTGFGLSVAAMGGLGGCSGPPPAAPPAPPDPDEVVREAAAGRERTLLAAYAAALSARPEQSALLSDLRAQHEVHLAQLTGPPPSPSTGPASASTNSGAATPVPAAAPPSPPPSPQDLVRLEREGAAAHTAAALAADDGALAGLLASLAASEASHPTALA